MRLISLAILLAFLKTSALAQLVTFNGTGNLPVPPTGTIGITQSPCTVTNIGVLGGCVTIDNVQINLVHTFVGDIGILLIGPGGQVLDLSTGNGGAGDDYQNTIFRDDAADFITSGTPPYAGTFRPEGRATTLPNPYTNAPPLGTRTFANTYNGTNANGVWILYINDYVGLDLGILIDWSITFNQGGAPPVADAGLDKSTCAGQSTTLTASGGGNYAWNTGATTATITVSPSVATTYTVTVTNPGCGTDTDEVIVSIDPPPAVSLSVASPDVCVGGCQTITANFTGTAPFTLTYKTITSNGVQTTFTESFSSNFVTFEVCPPAGTTLGNLQVLATSLTDALCTCN